MVGTASHNDQRVLGKKKNKRNNFKQKSSLKTAWAVPVSWGR